MWQGLLYNFNNLNINYSIYYTKILWKTYLRKVCKATNSYLNLCILLKYLSNNGNTLKVLYTTVESLDTMQVISLQKI